MHVTFDPYNFEEAAWMQADMRWAGNELISLVPRLSTEGLGTRLAMNRLVSK